MEGRCSAEPALILSEAKGRAKDDNWPHHVSFRVAKTDMRIGTFPNPRLMSMEDSRRRPEYHLKFLTDITVGPAPAAAITVLRPSRQTTDILVDVTTAGLRSRS